MKKEVKGNTGRFNSGTCNTGFYNTGYRNSGYRNSGDYNTGFYNTGYSNSGYRNSGNCNSGDCNSGNRNSGSYNTGFYNSGYRNSGDYNTGYCNSGDHNTGDYNLSSHNSGCFNTEEPKLKFFDKETDMTLSDWRKSKAFHLLRRVQTTSAEWVIADEMTDKEKKDNPEYKTTRGYLKVCNNANAFPDWWASLTKEEKDEIKRIPNFNAEKFQKITGINTESEV